MITIGQPYIKESSDRACLVSRVSNEAEGIDLDVLYSVETQYKEFLCDETADAFVLPLLLRAVVSNQDIRVDAPMSEKLYHNLKYGVLYALSYARKTTPKVYGLRPQTTAINKIKISCSTLVANNYQAKGVGTGCSLGVDSFSVIKKYLLDEDCLPSYKITHFACFNVGAFGSFNTDETRKSFFTEVERLKVFSEKLNIPVVSVDTNLHEFYPEKNFNWSHTFLNMGCVLALQKLWGKYLYAAGYSLDRFKWDLGDSAKYEPFVISQLSTESTELISSDMEKSRSDKVRYIMDDEIVKQNITVCLREQSINNGKMNRDREDEYLNCGHCEKCLRTMLQLDIFGVLDNYSTVFNLSEWPKLKYNFITKVLALRDKNLMYNDIASTMVANAYPIPSKIKYRAKILRLKQYIKTVIRG